MKIIAVNSRFQMFPHGLGRWEPASAGTNEKIGRADNLQLISITLDPEYDTPGILNAYASSRGIDTANFSFLTGPEPAILDLMSQLGVLAFPEDGLIRHTLATILIDEKGRIIYRTDTSGWEPEEFLKRLRRPETDPARPS